MALPQPALSELLEAFRTGEGVNLIQDAVKLALQELIEAEATQVIDTGRYERTEERRTERNGTRPRVLTTTAGDVQLRISELRKGSFFPSILNPRRRIDQALYAVVMEARTSSIWRSHTLSGELARGLEPLTACLQDRCATNCATPARPGARAEDGRKRNRAGRHTPKHPAPARTGHEKDGPAPTQGLVARGRPAQVCQELTEAAESDPRR
jgi:hypothetical protein